VKLPQPSPGILEAREFLRSRILQRAIDEGEALAPLEVEYLDSDHLSNEREIMERFDGEYEFEGYVAHIGGLLRRARDADAESDPGAPAKYEAMAQRLNQSHEDFILYSCAVIGLTEPKTMPAWPWLAVILIVAAIAAYYLAKTRGLIP
jgi:hypothetical protein